MTTPEPSYRELPLTQGQVALVDAEDFDRCAAYKWHAQWIQRAQKFYAGRRIRYPDGRERNYPLASFIMGLDCGDSRIVDHINRDTLDDRKCNLRVCDQTLNIANQRLRKDNKSGYKGVSRHNQTPAWTVNIRAYGRVYYLGCFPLDRIEDAARAYDKAARHHFGEFAVLNFPDH